MIILLSMRRLLVLSCLVVASAEPTDKAKAKIDANIVADNRTPPRHSGARPRRPLWVAVMACLWGDVLSKTKPGDTGPRRPQDSHWRDHGLGSSHTANPQKYRFHPQVLAVSVSLDHERTERSSNLFCWSSSSCGCPANASAQLFFGHVPYRNPSRKRESRSHFHLLTARVVLPRRPTRIASS